MAKAKDKGGAPPGNKNAEKWTVAEVLPILEKIEKEASKPNCYYLGTALVAVKLYKEVWAYWCEKFKDEEVVFQSIKRINQVFEAKLYGAALSGGVDKTVAIFGLKNNHDWKDKQEVESNTNISINWEEKKNYQK